jgi:hypothetical protein
MNNTMNKHTDNTLNKHTINIDLIMLGMYNDSTIKNHNRLETKYLKNKPDQFNKKYHNLKQFNHTKKSFHTRKLRW